jgi:hypothetical protein
MRASPSVTSDTVQEAIATPEPGALKESAEEQPLALLHRAGIPEATTPALGGRVVVSLEAITCYAASGWGRLAFRDNVVAWRAKMCTGHDVGWRGSPGP